MAAGAGGGGPRPVRVTFLSRRPYACGGVEHVTMDRQIANEGAVLARLRAIRGVNVTRRDWSCAPPREQLAAAAATDVLVAMHGGALTHALFLPDGAAVVEIVHTPRAWRVFEHLARMRGLAYFAHVHTGPAQADGTGELYSLNAAKVSREGGERLMGAGSLGPVGQSEGVG